MDEATIEVTSDRMKKLEPVDARRSPRKDFDRLVLPIDYLRNRGCGIRARASRLADSYAFTRGYINCVC